jgi:hypothetical protein
MHRSLLVTYDWGEAFVAVNLVLKPMLNELFLTHVPSLALGKGDYLRARFSLRSMKTASGTASGARR